VITEEERQSIINEAVEKALLKLPEVVGNLLMNQANILRLTRTFYEKNPELTNSKDIVASVIENLEGNNPGLKYEELLEKAVPLIKEQIKTTSSMDFKSINKPPRQLTSDFGDL
jgi:hypothetical protein